jgi:hypothetical protein
MVGLLIIACIAPLFIKGPGGEPVMTLNDWKIDVPHQVKDLVGSLTRGAKKSPPVEEQQPMQVYKWQDDEGLWHFSNAPPNLEIAEEIEISDVNLMEAYLPPPAPPTDAGELNDSGPMSVSPGIPEPGQVQEMRETIEQFQETINERKEALDTLSAQQN